MLSRRRSFERPSNPDARFCVETAASAEARWSSSRMQPGGAVCRWRRAWRECAAREAYPARWVQPFSRRRDRRGAAPTRSGRALEHSADYAGPAAGTADRPGQPGSRRRTIADRGSPPPATRVRIIPALCSKLTAGTSAVRARRPGTVRVTKAAARLSCLDSNSLHQHRSNNDDDRPGAVAAVVASAASSFPRQSSSKFSSTLLA